MAKMYNPVAFCCVQGGIYRRRISKVTPNVAAFPLLLLCNISDRNDRGLVPGRDSPLLLLQGSRPGEWPYWLGGVCSSKIPVILKKPIRLDRPLC